MAKSKFAPKGVNTTDNVVAQNDKQIKRIKPSADMYADGPVVEPKPHDLFDERTVFSKPKDIEKSSSPIWPNKADLSSLVSAYPLSSGALAKAEILLLSDPLNESVNWENNPRKDEERKDTSDIDESIISYGLNVVPVIARRKNGLIQIIEGSRRRESCIRNHKPLLALVVDKMSDDDAKTISVFGNEGRKDPNVFSRVDGYQLLLDGDRPLCRSKADLARRLGMKREWVSQLMRIGELPIEIKSCLSNADLEALTAKRAIKLSKGFFSLSEDEQKEITIWAGGESDVGLSEVFAKVFGSLAPSTKENAKIGTMNILSRKDRVSVVQNKSTAGIFIQFPDGFDISELDDQRINKLLDEAKSTIK